ncbi:MAG: TIGR01548 family HAD-type hydrolase [Oscillatoria sp. PMC 1068.18]|nr:TIGR01548 family HAD-type hydrolase [Oscillatoria sp. PMC 1076.18]MEC4990267.1 TIGR01548 family HAD-type hydrolase [Oscillatoria sp. PMC 1068.18]
MSAIVIFDIDGVIRDVAGSYRRALADTVEHFTAGAYRPTQADIDALKSEGIWNNDWEGSQEMVWRYFESQGQPRNQVQLNYDRLVAFFQSRYRGTDPENWNGYITTEPLLLQRKYLENLTANQINWGFFSGATRGSAEYVLVKRLGLEKPVLIAMEDAPGKPDPTGLLATVKQLDSDNNNPVIYVGDTVADMYTVVKAKNLVSDRNWLGVGVLPPHVQENKQRQETYQKKLKEAGAATVINNVEQLTPELIQQLINNLQT